MISLIVLGVIAVAALAIVIVSRDSSALWIFSLLGIVGAFFMAGHFFNSKVLLLGGVLVFGTYLSWLARDELEPGRPWFVLVTSTSLVAAGFSFFYGLIAASESFVAVALCAGISLLMGYNKRWVRKRGSWESKV